MEFLFVLFFSPLAIIKFLDGLMIPQQIPSCIHLQSDLLFFKVRSSISVIEHYFDRIFTSVISRSSSPKESPIELRNHRLICFVVGRFNKLENIKVHKQQVKLKCICWYSMNQIVWRKMNSTQTQDLRNSICKNNFHEAKKRRKITI